MASAASAAAVAAAQECAQLKAQFGPGIDCTTALTLLSVGHLDFLSAYERHIVCVFQIVAILCCTVMISEYLNFLPREIWIIRNSRMGPGIIALLVNRYVGVFAVIVGAIWSLGNSRACKPLGWLFCLSFACQQGASSFIFLLRTKAIHKGNMIVTVAMSIGCALVTGSFIATAFSVDYGNAPVSLAPYGGHCILGGHVKTWRAASSFTTMAYDTVTLVLTIVGLLGYTVDTGSSKKAQRTVRKLALASLWYYIPVNIANISTIVIFFTTSDAVRALAMAYSGTVSQIAASRLVFDMQSTFGIRDRHSENGEGMTYLSSTGSAGTSGPEKINFDLEDAHGMTSLPAVYDDRLQPHA